MDSNKDSKLIIKMKLNKNKKGMWLSLISFLLLLIALIYTLAVINADQRENLASFRYVGERSLELMDIYTESQLNLTYYDSLGRIVFPKTLNGLGLGGGFYDGNECGQFAGFEIWIDDANKCKPNVDESLTKYFDDVATIYGIENSFLINYLGKGNFVASALNPIKVNTEEIDYSFRPNFKFNSGYDLNIYETAFKKAEEIVDVCKLSDNLNYCVNEKIAHYSKENDYFYWKKNCYINEEKIFYSFIEQYKDCLNSLDTNCYCEIDLKNFEGYVSDIKMKIKIENNGNISFNNVNYIFDHNPAIYGDIGYLIREDFFLFLEYDENGILIRSAITSQDIDFNQLMGSHNYDDLYLYKQDQNTNALIQNYGLLNQCRTYTRHVTLCIESVNEFLIYDFKNDRLNQKTIPLQFSIFVPDLVPPNPVEFKVHNDPFDKEKIVLQINRSEAEDISHYNVYLDKTKFNSIQNLNVHERINDNRNLNVIERRISVEEDNVIYYVAVTPVDIFGNENDDIKVLNVTSYDNRPTRPIAGNTVSGDVNMIDNSPGVITI